MNFNSLKFVNIASEAVIAERTSQTLVLLSQNEPSTLSADAQARALTDRELQYLAAVADKPNLPATARDRELGISNKLGNSLRGKLRELGLTEEVLVNPGGTGRHFRDVRLTALGKATLNTHRKTAV